MGGVSEIQGFESTAVSKCCCCAGAGGRTIVNPNPTSCFDGLQQHDDAGDDESNVVDDESHGFDDESDDGNGNGHGYDESHGVVDEPDDGYDESHGRNVKSNRLRSRDGNANGPKSKWKWKFQHGPHQY